MRIDVYIHDAHDDKLNLILQKVTQIMATQAELAASLTDLGGKLDAIGTEVDKVSSETQSLQAEIATLKDAINNQGNTTPEVDAALAAVVARADSLATKVKAVDDLVPDAPVTP